MLQESDNADSAGRLKRMGIMDIEKGWKKQNHQDDFLIAISSGMVVIIYNARQKATLFGWL